MSPYSDPQTAQQRAQAIVEEVVARRRSGEVISDQQVLQQHPDLLGTLESLLRRAAMVQSLRPDPNPLEDLMHKLAADPELDDDSRVSGLEDQLKPLAPTDDFEDFVDEGPEGDRITFDDEDPGGGISPDLDPQTPVGVYSPEMPSSTWTEPGSTGGDPNLDTANLYQSPGYGEAARYRPIARPPMAILRLFDDNQAGAEFIRIRKNDTTIGREAADILVPHDSMISSIHARIERVCEESVWRWRLRDLKSTNGVFVKARKIRLRDGDQLLIGNRVIQFSHEDGDRPAQLDEVRNDGGGQWLELSGGDCWIGRDSSICESFLADEPTVDNRFARLIRRPDGRWTIWSNNSVNGLWVRIHNQIELVGGSMFQLGEQRFSFHTP